MKGRPMPALRILDDRQRELIFLRPPRRIVSLVPSETQSVLALGAGDRLLGRTRYCDAPGSVPLVGGTKDVDVDAVARLRPELILANQRSEEHTSELQSQSNLVCRLLLEKKKKTNIIDNDSRYQLIYTYY